MEVILLKYGEVVLKGLNRSKFEDLLVKNIKKAVGKANIASIWRFLYFKHYIFTF